MPYLVVAKMRRIWIRFPFRKDQRADGVEQSACNEQGDGSRAKLRIDRADQKDDDPAHQQKTDIRHQDGNLAKENGLNRNKENRQTPDDPE